MKKIIHTSLATVFAMSIYAESVTWNPTTASSVTGYYDATNTSNWNPSALPNESSDITVSKAGNMYIDDDTFKVSSATFTKDTGNYRIGLNNDAIFETVGDFTLNASTEISSLNSSSSGRYPTLNVGKNLTINNTTGSKITIRLGYVNAEGKSRGPLNLKIGGDFSILNNANVYLNPTTTNSLVDVNADGKNANTYIGGKIILGTTGSNELSLINRQSTNVSTQTVISCAGLSGKGIINHAYYQYTGNICTAVLHLRNSEDLTYTGRLTNGNNSYGRTKLIMQGTATQTIKGDYDTSFSGGVEMRSGTLQIISATNDAKASHGQLTMMGGTFKINDDNSSTSTVNTFGFSDIAYSGGVIQLNIGTEANDYITLTEGTISYLDDFTGNVEFKLTGNLELLLTQKLKLISWTQDTTIDDSSFVDVDNDFYFESATGKSYDLTFTSEADGLYAQYIQIPEPSVYAGILGIMALTFAIYRRKK